MAGCQKSCSVPGGMGTRLKEAAEENDLLESEVIRRALRFYENENPDEFAAFEDVSHGPSVANVAEIDPATLPTKETEKPVEEALEETVEETDEKAPDVGAETVEEEPEVGTNSNGDGVLSGGVYDPCEEVK